MDLATNKEHARELLQKLSDCMIEASDLTEDFHCWSLFSGRQDRDTWLASIRGKHKVQVGPSNHTLTAMTAEDDRVVIEYVSDTKLINGKNYRNNYHTLMVLRDGKLAKIKEFMDTRYLVEMLGPLVPRMKTIADELTRLETCPEPDA
jgi:ketosteroid isomerase-like protein